MTEEGIDGQARGSRQARRRTDLWPDEMGLRSDQAAGRSFAPRGRTPVVGKTGQRFGCNVIQAVSNRGELCFRVFEGSFTQAVYRDFLNRLVAGRRPEAQPDRRRAPRPPRQKGRCRRPNRSSCQVHGCPATAPSSTPPNYSTRTSSPTHSHGAAPPPRRTHRRHPLLPPPPPETTRRDPQLLPPPRRRLRSLTVSQLPAGLVTREAEEFLDPLLEADRERRPAATGAALRRAGRSTRP